MNQEVQFSDYSVSLSGTPEMSENCWQAIRNSVRTSCKSGKTGRYLEWGSGNSTLAVLRDAVEHDTNLEVVSVEHHREFFLSMVNTIQGVLPNASLSFFRINGPSGSYAALKQFFARMTQCEAWLLQSVYLTGNKTLFEATGRKPNHRLRVSTLIRQLVKNAARDLRFSFYQAQKLSRARILGKGDFVFHESSVASFDHSVAGKAVIRDGRRTVTLYLLPHMRNPFDWRGRTADGLSKEFFSYVLYPFEGKFDTIFIDGRARVSCMKRVVLDDLLSPGGTAFVHDGFSGYLQEGFQALGGYAYMNGSNKKTDGKPVYPETGPPFVRTGDTSGTLERKNDRELYLFTR